MADISISSAGLVSALVFLVNPAIQAKVKKKLRQTILRYLQNNKRRQIAFVNNAVNRAVERRFWIEPSRDPCYFWETTISLWAEDKKNVLFYLPD